jgi:hypothetical protein
MNLDVQQVRVQGDLPQPPLADLELLLTAQLLFNESLQLPLGVNSPSPSAPVGS